MARGVAPSDNSHFKRLLRTPTGGHLKIGFWSLRVDCDQRCSSGLITPWWHERKGVLMDESAVRARNLGGSCGGEAVDQEGDDVIVVIKVATTM